MHAEAQLNARVRDTFRAVNSMSILCLWNIQLTLDWDEIEPYGAYLHKSEWRCKCVQECLKSDHFCGSYRNFRTGKTIFAEVIAILEPARSTRMDISIIIVMIAITQYGSTVYCVYRDCYGLLPLSPYLRKIPI